MSPLVPAALVNKQELLDPAVLDRILENCSQRAKNWLGRGDIICLGVLLLYPERELLKATNFGTKSLHEIREAVEPHGYTMEQGVALFPEYEAFLKRSGILRKMNFGESIAQDLAAIHNQVAELYGIETEPSPSKEIYLEMSLPEAIVIRIAQNPHTSRDLNKFCRDSFENAVRYFFSSDPPYPPTAVSNNPSPDNKCKPLRIPIPLSHAWTSALNPSFLQKLATQLSSSAALRYQIMKEFGPATPK